MFKSLVITALGALALAAPSNILDGPLGVSVQADGTPLLNLGYVVHKPTTYDKASDVYTFKNIRFAKPPLGELRWQKPAEPEKDATIRDGTLGNQCIQSPTGPEFMGISADGSEDCLFLDLNVPGKALLSKGASNLPVVVWIFGGAYSEYCQAYS
jgi:hypothetical protein